MQHDTLNVLGTIFVSPGTKLYQTTFHKIIIGETQIHFHISLNINRKINS